jgi:septum formation protein
LEAVEDLRPPIVLASGSPRRGEILANAGIAFVREIPPYVDETPSPGELPLDYVKRLALEKASAITVDPSRIVLGADTTVVIEGEILGKPSDAGDAARMLRRISGRMHEVITGICLINGRGQIVDAASTRVWFAALSDSEIEDYVASGEPMDKAGAYGIQGLASKFVTRIEGCYFNVMGLPISLVYTHLHYS